MRGEEVKTTWLTRSDSIAVGKPTETVDQERGEEIRRKENTVVENDGQHAGGAAPPYDGLNSGAAIPRKHNILKPFAFHGAEVTTGY